MRDPFCGVGRSVPTLTQSWVRGSVAESTQGRPNVLSMFTLSCHRCSSASPAWMDVTGAHLAFRLSASLTPSGFTRRDQEIQFSAGSSNRKKSYEPNNGTSSRTAPSGSVERKLCSVKLQWQRSWRIPRHLFREQHKVSRLYPQ